MENSEEKDEKRHYQFGEDLISKYNIAEEIINKKGIVS